MDRLKVAAVLPVVQKGNAQGRHVWEKTSDASWTGTWCLLNPRRAGAEIVKNVYFRRVQRVPFRWGYIYISPVTTSRKLEISLMASCNCNWQLATGGECMAGLSNNELHTRLRRAPFQDSLTSLLPLRTVSLRVRRGFTELAVICCHDRRLPHWLFLSLPDPKEVVHIFLTMASSLRRIPCCRCLRSRLPPRPDGAAPR